LRSHSADLPHHLVTVGMFYGQDLGFDHNRLTVSASVASSYWECNSPASLARFPCKLVLMPIRCNLSQRTSAGSGRHCFASDDRFQPALLCGLFAAPSGFHNSFLSFQTAFFSRSDCDSPKSFGSDASLFFLFPISLAQDLCPFKNLSLPSLLPEILQTQQ
jgi:hypothetical protein